MPPRHGQSQLISPVSGLYAPPSLELDGSEVEDWDSSSSVVNVFVGDEDSKCMLDFGSTIGKFIQCNT